MLRVGELIRHASARLLTRGEITDPVLEKHVVTVSRVKMSPDLKLATIYVMPLGGADEPEVLAALDRHKRFLRGELAQEMNLKFAPEVRFRIDDTFDNVSRIDALLSSDRVRRDLARRWRRRSQRGWRRGMNQQKSDRVVVDGWVVLDKPVGMTSTQAVSRLKRIYNAKKAGHAGTLDPLASGILPVAFGEATKTVPFVQDGEKTYLFTVRWGVETDTDDSDGRVVRESDARPEPAAIAALLPRFVGDILQTPPQYSAIKIAGERAYDLAREGEHVELQPRPVTIHRLDIIESAGDETSLVMDCGKGAYVRAIARDVGRLLGCFGHVTALRRTRVGPFVEQDSFTFEEIEAEGGAAAALQSVEAGLTELPCVVVDRDSAARLRRGGSLILRGRDAPRAA